MAGLRILITAGPTREHLDTVRFISNPSSGKMGYALAEAARDRGHRVTLVSGPVVLDPPAGVRVIRVTSAAEMAAASRKGFAACDVAIFTAAVSDYRPVRRLPRKAPKRKRAVTVRLEPTEDIAAALGRAKGTRLTVAFAFEDHDGRAHAEAKMLDKNADAIVLNGPANVGSDRAKVEVLVRGGRWQRWPAGGKRQIAERLMQLVERLHSRPA